MYSTINKHKIRRDPNGTIMTKIITILSICTWYGEAHEGKTMANGEPFCMDCLTCATYLWPLGTQLEVEYKGNKVFVEVTDRCDDKTEIDLSKEAFNAICDLDKGRIEVAVTFRYEDQTKVWKDKYGEPVEPILVKTSHLY